jgi:hypothetical protein
MSNLWARDDRIDDGTALRDLEKKVHFLMSLLCNAGIITTRGGNQMDVPDDIANDGNEVGSQIPTSL